jgi:hypothetical protein
MTTNTEHRVELPLRQIWLKERVHQCIDSLYTVNKLEDWDTFRRLVIELSAELDFAVTQWDQFERFQ